MSEEAAAEPEAKRPWWRRLLRGVFLAFFWPLIFVGTLIATTIFHLDSAPARRELCDRVEPVLDDMLRGDFELECIEISPDRVAVADFIARDSTGHVVLRVESASVDISRWDLFFARLVVEQVRFENPFVDLSPNEATGELRIADAFTPVDPAPEDPNAKKTNIPRIVVEDVVLEGGRVHHISPQLDARGLRLHAEGVIDDRIDITFLEVGGELMNLEGQVVASVERLDGEASILEPGAETNVTLRIDAMGDDFVAGTVGMVWGEEIPDVYRGDLEFHASPETFAAAGLSEVSDILQSPVSGTLSADGSLTGTFTVAADLSTEGGDVTLRAELAQEFEHIVAHVETGGLDLAEVLVPVDEGRFEGTVDAEMHPPGEDGRRRVVVDGRDLQYAAPDGNTYGAPALHVAAFLGNDHVELLELDVPHLEGDTGHLDVTGRVGFDGAVDVVIDAELPNLGADPNLAQVVPGNVDGGLTIDARLKLDPNRDFAMDFDGRVAGRNLQLPWLDARRLDVRGTVRGSLPAPQADLTVDVEGLKAGNLSIANASLRVDGGSPSGGAGTYHLRGEVDGSLPQADADTSIDIVARVDEQGVTVDGTAEVRGLYATPITAEFQNVRYDPSSGVRAESLRVRTADGMGVAMSGFLDLNGRRSDARVQLTDVDLEKIAKRLGLERLGLRGTASAEVAFQGSTQAPLLDTSGRVEGFQISGVAFETLRWDVNIEEEGASSSVLVVQLSVESAGNGRAELNARGRVPERNPLQALPQAYWDAQLTTTEFRVGLLPEVIEGLPPIDGRVDTRITLDGTIERPERLAVAIDARDLAIPGFTTVNGRIEGDLTGRDLRVAVGVLYPDDQELVSVETQASGFELMEVIASDTPLAFLSDPWSVEIAIPERPLSEFPAPLGFPVPMTASLRGRFWGGGASSPMGKAQRADFASVLDDVHGRVEGWARYDADVEAGCAEGRPELQLELELEDGKTVAKVLGRIAGQANFLLEASALTPVAEWARQPPTEIPEVQLDLETRDLPLHSVPFVCRYAEGTLNFDLAGRRIFAENPDVELEAVVDSLVIGGSEALRFHMKAGLDATDAQARIEMSAADRVALRIEGNAPMTWGGDQVIPAVRNDGPWDVRAEFDRAPLQPILAAVPMIADPSGTIDGRIRAHGVGKEAEATGRLEMVQAGFTLRRPYMRVEDLNGALELRDDQFLVHDIKFKDRDGEAHIDGRITLDGWMPDQAELVIRTDDFPLRVEGVIYAYLDTHTEISADFGEERNRVAVAMDRTSVRLPMDIGRSLQPLAQHADVIYENQPGFDPNAPFDDPAEEAASTSAFADVTVIQVRSEPFWVRRDDFAVQVRPRLDLWIDQDGVKISGPVQIRRGFIAFMGKEFEFRRGEVRFTGGNTIDPQVDMEATYDLGGGEVITAKISGRLLQPDLDFSSSRDPDISNSEAIQLLVRGRAGGSSETATEQAASFLTGMFAGVLSSVTRQELGEFIPVFGIESEGGNTTLRVGFQADQLIPDALDDFILGAYVEGYVGGSANGTSGGSTGGAAVTGGAVIEFVLPRNLVWTGTYDVPTNWSTDLLWEP